MGRVFGPGANVSNRHLESGSYQRNKKVSFLKNRLMFEEVLIIMFLDDYNFLTVFFLPNVIFKNPYKIGCLVK